MKVIRTERGWTGHFFGTDSCRFRRNTLLECEESGIRIVVSTVGDYAPESKATTTRNNWFYETMAFHALFDLDTYWEPDYDRQVDFESERAIDRVDDKTDAEANLMHESVVIEIERAMIDGETYEEQGD